MGTADYENDVNPTVRAALSAALQDDEQLEVEAQENLPSMGGWTPDSQMAVSTSGSRAMAAAAATKMAAKARRKKSAAAKASNPFDDLLGGEKETEAAFPQSRG